MGVDQHKRIEKVLLAAAAEQKIASALQNQANR